jgi:hypothetical protein
MEIGTEVGEASHYTGLVVGIDYSLAAGVLTHRTRLPMWDLEYRAAMFAGMEESVFHDSDSRWRIGTTNDAGPNDTTVIAKPWGP